MTSEEDEQGLAAENASRLDALEESIKEREHSFLRSLKTLVEDYTSYERGDRGFPKAALLGAVFAYLRPRLILVLGSVAALVIAFVQVWILLTQNTLIEQQNKLIAQQVDSQNRLVAKQNELLETQNRHVQVQSETAEVQAATELLFRIDPKNPRTTDISLAVLAAYGEAGVGALISLGARDDDLGVLARKALVLGASYHADQHRLSVLKLLANRMVVSNGAAIEFAHGYRPGQEWQWTWGWLHNLGFDEGAEALEHLKVMQRDADNFVEYLRAQRVGESEFRDGVVSAIAEGDWGSFRALTDNVYPAKTIGLLGSELHPLTRVVYRDNPHRRVIFLLEAVDRELTKLCGNVREKLGLAVGMDGAEVEIGVEIAQLVHAAFEAEDIPFGKPVHEVVTARLDDDANTELMEIVWDALDRRCVTGDEGPAEPDTARPPDMP